MESSIPVIYGKFVFYLVPLLFLQGHFHTYALSTAHFSVFQGTSDDN